MNLGFGHFEILVILIILLVVIGPRKLPELLRNAGKLMGQLRRASDELRNEILYSDEFRSIQDTIDGTKESFTPPPVPPPLRTKKKSDRDTEKKQQSSPTSNPPEKEPAPDKSATPSSETTGQNKGPEHQTEVRDVEDQGGSSHER